jgi:hypothetical protein
MSGSSHNNARDLAHLPMTIGTGLLPVRRFLQRDDEWCERVSTAPLPLSRFVAGGVAFGCARSTLTEEYVEPPGPTDFDRSVGGGLS